MLELAVLILSVLLNGLLGFIVYYKNPKSATNRLFFMLTISLIAWSTVNYISVHPAFLPQLIWIRLVLFCAAPLCLMVFLTFTIFPAHTMEGSSRIRKIAILYTLAVMGLILTSAVFKRLAFKNGSADPIPGFGIIFFIVLVVGLLGGGIWNLVGKYRRSKGKQRMQLRFVLVGLAGAFGLIFLTNFVLVVVFKNSSLIPLGPAYTLIFSGSLAYAIVRHRLFDIRQAAARGLAYTLTLGFLATAYSVTVFGISSLVLGSQRVGREAQIVNTVLALALAFSSPTIKRFFDKLSNRVFYKDRYDPQQFLDQLNQILVTEVELPKLLQRCVSLIEANLKAESCTFVIRKTAYFPVRIMGDQGNKFERNDIEQLQPLIIDVRQKVIVADYLDGDDAKFGSLLQEKDMAVIIKLVPSLNRRAASVGELVLGAKKNGDPYSSADIKIMEIIANELVIAIQNALRFEEIQNFNITLQGKVDEATRKLRRVNERLKTLDETKDDFISMASHQLRTPLTSVKGYISMVLEGDAGKISPMQKKLLTQSFFSSQRMVYLIADLLNVSRLKTGKFVIEAAPVNLAEVVEQELAQLKETAAAHSLELTYQKPKHFPELMLDETKTRQVIMNFADNSIYYTPSGGHITVRLVENPATVELRVEDNGIGVPRGEQPHLFTKFYRAGNARKARPDGTGLGLFMAKKVIVAQGGALIFESQEKKGSTFGFVFSKHKLAVPPTVQTPPSS